MKPSFTILGARGTMPVAGKQFARYGGRTTCFSLKTGAGIIVIDAGTGISLIEENNEEELRPATILFTHFHIDHIMALPSLKRFYNHKSLLKLMADSSRQPPWPAALLNLFAPPYWPIALTATGAGLEFADLPSGANSLELYGAHVSWCPLFHPQGCLAYRLETAGRAVVVVTDHESGNGEIDRVLQAFCSKADYLIHDAQWTPEELPGRRGWGHSSWADAVDFAVKAGVGELILTHHHYLRQDDEIDAYLALARGRFPRTRAATDGMTLF